MEMASYWDICNLYEQVPESRSIQLFSNSFAKKGYLVATIPDSFCPYLTFETDWEGLLKTKSRKFRQNLKASSRKLKTLGSLEYASYEKWPELEDCFEQYKILESKSWKQDKKVGINRDQVHYSFYYELAKKFSTQHHFNFRILKLDGNPIAATFGLVHNKQFYSLHIVYDPEYRKFSPGTLLESMELEECINKGFVEYDFLGGFLNNKLRWTRQYRETEELFVYRKDSRLSLIFFLYFKLKPGIKQILDKIGLKDPFFKYLEKLKK
jgi:CelD/BcsL family acetyltransferase involved in cellulose biosynthesis